MRSKVPTLKGTEASLSYIQCFLYLGSSVNVSIFHIIWVDTFWIDLVYVCFMLIPCCFDCYGLVV